MKTGRFRWVERLSGRGIPYRVAEPVLPRIADHILHCVIYLYPSEAAAQDGLRIGGSGFVVGVPLNPPHNTLTLPVVVTNKHVIDKGNMIVRVNTADGKADTIALDGEEWFWPSTGEDLAICPVLTGGEYIVSYVRPWSFVSQKLIDELAVGPGDDVFFVGRFVNREGRQQNTPTVRFGNIAQMPIEPLVLEDGTRHHSFLIEARSIAGFSGSPVFLHFLPQPGVPEQLLKNERFSKALPKHVLARQFTQYGLPFEPHLLGIDYCHIFSRDPVINKVTGEPHPDWYVKSNTGMMGVVPAWKLAELLERKDVKRIIDDLKARLPRADDVTLDVASESAPPATDANPTHREDFTRLLGAAARKQPQGD